VTRDQGEGRFVVIRGIDPNLNSTNLEGIPLPSPDGDERAVLLDVIPSNIVESLRVSKTVLPDEPHDGVGGHVEVQMPSAFDKKGRTLRGTLQANYDDLAEETNGRFSVTFGDRFGSEDKLGVLAALTYDKRDLASDNQESEPWELEDGRWVPEELEYREYDLSRERWGLVANLEYRPRAATKYFIRGNYNELEDTEIRRLLNYEVDELGAFGNYEGTADWEVANELKDRTETMSEYVLSAGGRNTLDNWEMDYIAGYSHSEEDTPSDVEVIYELADAFTGSYSGGSGYHPEVQFETGIDPRDPANYEFDEVEDENQLVEDDNWYADFNVRRDLGLALPVYVKAGASVLFNEKTSDVETFVSDENPATLDTLEGSTGSGRKEFFDKDVPIQDENLTDVYADNKAAFAMERSLADSFAEDYENNEDVLAGYLMSGVTFNRMNVIGGVRVEYTDFETRGYQVIEEEINDEDLVTISRVQDENDYTNVLPGLHYRWDIQDEFIFRASWTNTIARPTHEQSRLAETIEDGDVERGNPELDPYQSMNFDASIRYYLPNLGMVSLAGFYKNIDDFIFQQTIEGASPYTDGDGEAGDLTTFNNGDSGDIYGIEIGYQQQFKFLPAPFDGFGFNTNVTFTDSEATVPPTAGEPERDIPFIRQSDTIGNASLFYEKYGFSFRVAGSYRSDYLDELGETEVEDRYIDDHFQVDISTSYSFNENFTGYVDLVNVNEEPLRAYWDKSGALSQYEEYGIKVKAGVKWTF
jgi:TonB-dependent receptor